jgi:hypothetical protein
MFVNPLRNQTLCSQLEFSVLQRATSPLPSPHETLGSSKYLPVDRYFWWKIDTMHFQLGSNLLGELYLCPPKALWDR